MNALLVLATGGSSAARATQVLSIWDFCVKGGIVMIPIGFCSLVALALVVERAISLRRRRVIPPDFLPGVRQALAEGGRGVALERCRGERGPLGPIFAAVLTHLDAPREQIEKYAAQAGEREVLHLRRYLRAFTTVVSLAPMLGLLGTVFGMINAFQTVAASAEALGRTELLAKGIYEALITTAAGLMVAIPTLVAYHWVVGRVDHRVAEIDALLTAFLDEFAERGAPAARPGRNGDEAPQPTLQPAVAAAS